MPETNCRIHRQAVKLLASGAAMPGRPIMTGELLSRVELNFGVSIRRMGEKIADRLGIHSRYFVRDMINVGEVARPGCSNPELAALALFQCLVESGINAPDLGYLISHTTTPHTLLPPNASWVAERLSYERPYLELRQACCGFATALQIAAGFLLAPNERPIAIVGSETGSVFLDPRTCQRERSQLVNLLQMGDGAAAVIVGTDDDSPGPRLQKLFTGTLPGKWRPGIQLRPGGSGFPNFDGAVSSFDHDITAVRDHGPELLLAAAETARKAGADPRAATWIVAHQASVLVPKFLASKLRIALERFIIDCDTVGNLGSASIWHSLDRIRRSGKLRAGDTVLFLGAEASRYLYGGFEYVH